MNFTIENNKLTLRPAQLCSTDIATVRYRFEEWLKEPWTDLCLDLTATKVVDSSGLNLMMGMVARMKGRGKMSVLAKPGLVCRTLHFTKINEQLELIEVG